ncbi:MAG: Fic family protein [Candidatus Gottesmanbacteria bacterium GW2011_GWA2_43_14]|uniref:Fic family protein n=1 Tax=Candidatus Gottesmanbacteria bacterium GW2011_GWA2_43_14 TaxID=1618443 RepID=A0A0G1DL27_9BACT|nr:MAG: Fic family protein [Candidatus Gottesmanbacteria bacterium GW2011_GWA2_43_14]
MLTPRYTITDRLLSNIKRVNALVNELNNRRFPNVVLIELEKTARAVSTYASTSIEGNPFPLTEVKKILISKSVHIRDSEKEILNYNQALQNLNEKLEKAQVKLSLNLILRIQKEITKGLLPKFESGKLREKPVVVNDPRTRKVIYLPPDAKDVKKLIEDLIGFVNSNRNEIDPLILAGIFHKQMVIIHPFMDGNGRTTRLATKVLLAEMGLNTFNLFSFEHYYNKNVTKYFQTVGEFGNYYELTDKIDFTPWLEYFTEGIIDELLRVQKLLPQVGMSPETQLKPYHLKMLEFIKERGFISDRDYAKLVDRAKATRALDFKKLIELGLISRKAKGKATFYVLREK